jgi:flavodoxin
MSKIKIIVLIISGIIVLFILLFILGTKYCTAQNEKQQDNKEILTKGGSKQALILYQESQSSVVTDSVDKISQKLLANNYSVTQNHPRNDLNYKLDQYELVIFVSPVYARRVAKPMENFIENNNFKNNKVLVLLTGMLDDKGEVEKVTKKFTNTKAIEVIKAKSADDTVMQKIEGIMKE